MDYFHNETEIAHQRRSDHNRWFLQDEVAKGGESCGNACAILPRKWCDWVTFKVGRIKESM
jgi:hypothetical protein